MRRRNLSISVLAVAVVLQTACSSSSKVGTGAGSSIDGGNGSGTDAPGININVGDGPGAGLPGTNPGTPAVEASPYCLAFGQACTSGAECCQGLCDPGSKTCVASINKCTQAGGACQNSTECCSFSCTAGRCSANACVADNQACTTSDGCCGGNCAAGVCQPLSTACRSAGNPCTTGTECCSTLCEGGVCKLGASFCIQTGDACSTSDACCSGDCKKGAGNLGVCVPPPSGATYCSDGVDGTVCGACNQCCSRLCAPYAMTGVRVCQPASGCRVNGDLCRKDSDCCGAAGTSLPGDGNVTCEKEAGKVVGICRNPRGCNPQGNVCHYTKDANYLCGVSSARNNCCGATGNSGVCQLDMLGVPRCNGLGSTCIKSGDICSSAMDCCDTAPCVPDKAGVLRCYSPPGGAGVDGGASSKCVPTGGSCSITADCCVGSTCIQPVGSTQGVCGTAVPPPASQPDGGGSTGPTPDASISPICAQYGQTCTVSADCCSGIPCFGGRCVDQVIF